MSVNPYAWNKKANVLYLESPGTVGFSKANDFYAIQNDTTVAKNNLIALIQFFTKYAWLKGNDFYIAGESYAGIYVPTAFYEYSFLDEDCTLRAKRIP